jgi:glycosyl transferase family 25
MIALIINLAGMSERWRNVTHSLRPSVDEGCLALQRQDAVNGDDFDLSESEEVVQNWDTSHNAIYVRKKWPNSEYAAQTLPLSAGERGCAMSHVRAWRQVVERRGPMLILEDDVVPIDGFADRFRVALASLMDRAPDADILYLSYHQAAPWRKRLAIASDPVSEDGCLALEEAEYLWTTAGYVLWPNGARTLLQSLPVDGPVDDFMAWPMARRRLKGYAVSPPLLNQGHAWNVDSSIQHSDSALMSRVVSASEQLAFLCEE